MSKRFLFVVFLVFLSSVSLCSPVDIQGSGCSVGKAMDPVYVVEAYVIQVPHPKLVDINIGFMTTIEGYDNLN